MRILAIITGGYGKRHVENITAHRPAHWEIESWMAPTALPLMIDYPEDYLPDHLPEADLILSFAEFKGVAELLPEIALMTGAKAVIAAVDNDAWLPPGLARQLRDWLARINVACATPKPLCSLTEVDYGVAFRSRLPYDDPRISEFATYFGQPKLEIHLGPNNRTIQSVHVVRDAVCGSARYVAERLVGCSVDDAEESAGLLHHHYPCWASMVKLPDFNHDTLMHASGYVLKENVAVQVKPFKRIQTIQPAERSVD